MTAHTLTHAGALASFPEARIETARRTIGYREAGATHLRTLPVVLLHGIGSGAASWVRQMEALGATRRVLAWDAPGYGASTPVAAASPVAADYAAALADWLDALDIERCVLVGHSLGAIIGGAFAARHASRVAGLLLVSPAGGYGAASAEEREAKRDARLAMLAELGPRGLADTRSANMLSAHASDEARDWVRWNMARIVPHGYAQATHLLANADLAADLQGYRGRVAVAVGADDAITPPAACERIANVAGVSLQVIPHAGHAGYVETPAAYTTLIDAFCGAGDAQRSN
ncbi:MULTISPECIES: alpha/beta fold hydrolase [unclassified Caballeronia]|uniref:alpha/beta fold hydrolase n=1 Tax=unclassified Caballeronia TaxID=2646786 RepID=UPI002857A10C|nr:MULTISPECIES: alpha/beta fold hydrolase [unclassified Caballeronia]MDR5752265.1 alpha/beta fold hydrolase [Caballeronia sp. LZ024]MDR5841783.1 alpha/beta fold hydrolase [Caballeronia sp. LZ031]